MNFSLRLAIDKAKAVNMPSDNIERSIKKGLGNDNKAMFERISYEAIMPTSVTLIIDCQTDNTNRTVSEIKKILEMGGGKLASQGSVSWQYNENGLIIIRPVKIEKATKYGQRDKLIELPLDDTIMELLEIQGIEDIEEGSVEDEDGMNLKTIEIITSKNDFSRVLNILEDMNMKIVSFEIIKRSKDQITLINEDKEKYLKLYSNLEEHDDVDSVWSNVVEG
jgi:YebC/PmpR family DNA-binding regulatory protein